jgi:hypothetical protein
MDRDRSGSGVSVVGSPNLKVDYALLESISGTIGKITPEINGMSANVSAYDYAYGSGDMANAMGGFANNWSKHKATMVSNLSNLQSLVQQAAEAFQKADAKLAREVTPNNQ